MKHEVLERDICVNFSYHAGILISTFQKKKIVAQYRLWVSTVTVKRGNCSLIFNFCLLQHQGPEIPEGRITITTIAIMVGR